ncbi:endonuclease/exonuclease/phosphatase family protein [Kitasatospora sp. NPDC050463]|uniref:endonuclease/exonuclease/phosphatase family protein n=1 Tax=Kitasatospora sp. NPDC050463 TaxID=3155786 RepID=UPI0033C04D13
MTALRARLARPLIAGAAAAGLLAGGLALAGAAPDGTAAASPSVTAAPGTGDAPGAGDRGEPVTAVAAQNRATVYPGRIMTWNLYAPGSAEPEDYAKEIAAYRPQVLGVQEGCRGAVQKTVEILKAKYNLNYNVAYGTALNDRANCGFWGGNAYGQAILSAAPITDQGNRLYPDGGSENRAYMWVTTVLDGKPVRVYDTHLAEADQSKVRAKQVEHLLKAIGTQQRVIVLGDLNSRPQGPELAALWNAGLRDADPACGKVPQAGCHPTADARPSNKKFDYILLRGINPPGVTVRDSVHSDHDIVYTTLDL